MVVPISNIYNSYIFRKIQLGETRTFWHQDTKCTVSSNYRCSMLHFKSYTKMP
jgi:hypothetical protein